MMTDMMKTLRENLPSAEEVLHQVGLERQHRAGSLLWATATFVSGAVVGAALGALFAPRSGRAIRQALRDRLHTARQRVSASTNGATDELAHPTGPVRGRPEGVASSG